MKGFSAHLVVFVVVALFGFGLFFFVFKSNESSVQGVSNVKNPSSGISVSLTSRNSSWDMFQYLCPTFEECTSSIDSGKRISKISGDITELKSFIISPGSTWDSFKFLKIYVRPSWDVLSSGFNVVHPGDVPETQVVEIPYGQSKQSVVILPIYEFSDVFYKSATFSD